MAVVLTLLIGLALLGVCWWSGRREHSGPPAAGRPERPVFAQRVIDRPDYLIARQLGAMELQPDLVDLVAECDRLIDEHEASADDAEEGRR